MRGYGLEVEAVVVGHQHHAVLGGKDLACKFYAAQIEDYLGKLFLPDLLVFAGEEHIRSYLTEANLEGIKVERR